MYRQLVIDCETPVTIGHYIAQNSQKKKIETIRLERTVSATDKEPTPESDSVTAELLKLPQHEGIAQPYLEY